MKVHSQIINSSALSFVAWDPDFHILYVQFPTGSCWVYHDVGFEHYYALINANSAGNYFNKNIRNAGFLAQRVFEGRKELAHAIAQ